MKNPFNKDKTLKQIRIDLEAGEKAKQLRENPIFSAAFLEEKAGLYDQFATSKWYQRKLRENIWARLQAVIAVEKKLKSAEAAAKYALEELEKIKD